MKVELTEQQINNLKVFLQRLQLTGSEVGAFVEILNALTKNQNSDKEEA